MQIESDKDFPELRKHFNVWRKRFPMFKHDVKRIEVIVEQHIKNHSIALMCYTQHPIHVAFFFIKYKNVYVVY
jgi:hypothetical protein